MGWTTRSSFAMHQRSRALFREGKSFESSQFGDRFASYMDWGSQIRPVSAYGKLYLTCPNIMLECAASGPVPATQGCRNR